jgi:hypothetical protein
MFFSKCPYSWIQDEAISTPLKEEALNRAGGNQPTDRPKGNASQGRAYC